MLRTLHLACSPCTLARRSCSSCRLLFSCTIRSTVVVWSLSCALVMIAASQGFRRAWKLDSGSRSVAGMLLAASLLAALAWTMER
jgi:hypothetical protein